MLEQAGEEDGAHVPLKLGRLAQQQHVLVVDQVKLAARLNIDCNGPSRDPSLFSRYLQMK